MEVSVTEINMCMTLHLQPMTHISQCSRAQDPLFLLASVSGKHMQSAFGPLWPPSLVSVL